MATKHNPIIVDAIEMVLSGVSVSEATDFAIKHGMENAIQLYSPRKPEYHDAWIAINREWKRRREGKSASGEPFRMKANPCEFTC